MRWLDLVWLAPVVLGLGCGGNVQFNSGAGAGQTSGVGAAGGSGGAGGGTAGGATAGSATGGSTGGVAGNGGATGGTTMTTTTTPSGDACMQACDKATQCGLPGDQCAKYLDCNTMQGACAAKCIDDPSVMCADIIGALQGQGGPLLTCLQGCQGGAGGAGGQGGAGGGPSMQCQQCGQNSCANAFQQCAQQAGFMTCQSWVNCVGKCGDSMCFDACTKMYPAAQPMATCLCTSCGNECANECSGAGGAGGAAGAGGGGAGGVGGAGGAGGGGGGPMQCQQCAQQNCQNELGQCFQGGFNKCQTWINCAGMCNTKACLDMCTAADPAAAPLEACICGMKCVNSGCGFTCN